jgi:hypothetical protein
MSTTEISTFIHYDNEGNILYELDAYAVIVTDYNYGADADGRRGIVKRFVDEVIFTEFRDKEGGEIPVEDVREIIPKDIVEELIKKAENHNWLD